MRRSSRILSGAAVVATLAAGWLLVAISGYAEIRYLVLAAAGGCYILLQICLNERSHRAFERRGRCPACGYDLRATPARCPECGAAPRRPRPGAMD